MIDPTLSSTNPSPLQETNEVSVLKDSNSKSQQPKNEDMFLSDIPVFNKKTSEPVSNLETLDLSHLEPSLCEEPPNEGIVEGKYEYEFSLCFDGCLCFVHLYDTSDVSACERVLHRPVQGDEIVYSSTSGNGFITDETFKYTFTKEPYKRTWTTHADIKTGVEYENTVARTQKKHMTADDILSSL